MSLPSTKAYVGEQFYQHMELLHQDQPAVKYKDALNASNTSWLSDIEADYQANAWTTPKPFVTGASYSQWRKVHLGYKLVEDYAKATGRSYSLIVRVCLIVCRKCKR